MKIGLGVLRYPPDVFWDLSLPEFFAAVDGLMESRGVKRGGGKVHDAPTKEEVDALFASLDEQGRIKP